MNSTVPKQAKQAKPRPKPARAVRILERPDAADPEGWFAFCLTFTTPMVRSQAVRSETWNYLAREIPADGMGQGCRGFELEKLGTNLEPTGEVYHVLLDPREGFSKCDCPGGEYHQHCKHLDGLAALRQAGKLPTYRSASSFAKNDPDGYAAHMASLGDFGGERTYGMAEGEYPDEPPATTPWDDFGPREEDIDPT